MDTALKGTASTSDLPASKCLSLPIVLSVRGELKKETPDGSNPEIGKRVIDISGAMRRTACSW